MQRAGVTQAVTRELFELVAGHKLVCSDEKVASEAPRTGIRMVPGTELRTTLEADYRAMREMLFGVPPSFDEVLGGLAESEAAPNALVKR